MADVKKRYTLEVVAQGLKEVVSELQVMNSQLNSNTGAKKRNSKSTKDMNTESDHFLKKQKGVGGLTNNNTKAFSKMADGLTGGLVPAYASVAANVFAITAAFGALERAADFRVMIDAAESLTVQTGRSLVSLSKQMKEITGDAITMKEALTSSSIAASAGFDDTTILKLTSAARNASVALGREMTDAMNRIFKGAIKAEPELLDELGIILRLEPATKKYAATLGKAVKDLTTFEKQQAIVNEVISQAEEKFGLLTDVDTNVYTKLSSSFSDISVGLLGFVNLLVTPVLSLFTSNIELLTIGILMLVKSVGSLAVPAFTKLGVTLSGKLSSNLKDLTASLGATQEKFEKLQNSKRFTETIDNAAIYVASRLKQIEDSGKMAGVGLKRAYEEVEKTGKFTTKSLGYIKASIKTIASGRSAGFNGFGKEEAAEVLKNLEEFDKAANLNIGRLAKLTAAYDLANTSLKRFSLTISTGFLLGFSKSYTTVSKANGIFATLAATYKSIAFAVNTDTIANRGFTASIERLARVSGAAIGSLTSIGAKLLNSLPIIGAITVAWSLFTGALHKLGATDLSSAMETQEDALLSAKVAAESYVNTIVVLPNTLDNLNKKLTSQANIMQSLSSSLKASVEEISKQGGFDWIDNITDLVGLGTFDQFKDNVKETAIQLSKMGESEALNELLQNFGGLENITRLSRKEAEDLASQMNTFAETSNRNVQGAKEGVLLLSNSFEQLQKNLDEVYGTLPKLSAAQASLVGLQSILSQVENFSIETLVDGLSTLSATRLTELGLGDALEKSKALADIIGNMNKELIKLKAKSKEERGFGTEYVKTLQNIKALEKGIDVLTLQAAEFGKESELALRKTIVEMQNVIDASKNLSDIKIGLNVKELTNDSLEKRISLTKLSAEAETKYLRLVTASDKVSRDSAIETLKVLEEEKKLILAKGKIIQGSKEDARLAKIATDELATKTKLEQIETRLLETRNKGAEEQLKLVKLLGKELENTFEFQGIDYFDKQANSIKSELIPAAEKLRSILKDKPEALLYLDQFLKGLRDAEGRTSILATGGYVTAGSSSKDIEKESVATKEIQKKIDLLNLESSLNDQLSGQLDNRLDKEYLITDAVIKQNMLIAYQANDIELLRSLEAQRVANLGLSTKAMEDNLATLEKSTKLELAGLKATDKLSKQKFDREQKAKPYGDVDSDAYKKALANFEKLDKAKNKLDFSEAIEASAGAMNDLADAMKKFSEYAQDTNLDQTANAMILMQSVGDSIGGQLGNMVKGFATLSNVSAAYEARLISIEDNKALSDPQKDLQKTQAGYIAIANSAGTLATMLDKGTEAGKAMILVAQAAAVANAANAVAAASGQGTIIYGAAMLAFMTSVLGMANIAFGGSNTENSGTQAEKPGKYGLIGGDALESSALNETMLDLVKINTALFSAENKLQLSILTLNDTFNKLAFKVSSNQGIQSAGDFTNTSTGGSSDSKNLVAYTAAGAAAGAAIGAVFFGPIGAYLGAMVGGFIGSLAGGVIGKLKSGLFGSSSTDQQLKGLELNIGAEITASGDKLVGRVTDAFVRQFIDVVTTSKSWFRSSTSINSITRDIELDPALTSAFQEALDGTLNVVNNSLGLLSDTIGLDIPRLLEGFSLNIDSLPINLFEAESDDISESIAAFFSNVTDEIFGTLFVGLEEFGKSGESFTDIIARISTQTIGIKNAFSLIGQSLQDTVFDSSWANTAAEALKLNTIAAWEEALLQQFKSVDDFQEMFSIFAKTVFGDEFLATTAVTNAENVIQDAKDALTSQLSNTGFSGLLNIISEDIDSSSLREFYETALNSGAFFGEAGARLEATVIKTGVALNNLNEATSDLEKALENLNSQYLRQIEAFGLFGKELDLLELSFNFEDAIKEAIDTGTDINLVEKSYALQRLDIIRTYNQEIVDSLRDAYSGVSNAILDIGQSFGTWDELIFQSIKVDKVSRRLAASLSNVDLSIFELDTSTVGLTDFQNQFESILNLSSEIPSSIAEQIDLTNELKDAVIDKYNTEVKAIEELESKWRDLSNSIGDYLDSLFLGDLSTLTNSQKLAEAQAQFNTDLGNIFSSDADAAERAKEGLLDSASALLEQASLFYAIGPQYQSIFNDVVDRLESVDSELINRLGISDTDIQTSALVSIKESTISQLTILNDVLAQLEIANSSTLDSDLMFMAGLLNDNFTDVIAKLDSLDSKIWGPIVDAISGINQFAKGSDNIEYDQLAMIHKGEAILTADTAASVRSGESIINNTNNYSNGDNSGIIAAIGTLTQVLAISQEELLDQSIRIEQATAKKNSTNTIPANTRSIV